MIVDPLADVECGQFQFPGAGDAQAEQRIREGKTLDGLLRIKVVPTQLVGEVKPGADDRRSAHAAGG